MEVSRTSMKVANVTVNATSHGLWLGFQAACARSIASLSFGAAIPELKKTLVTLMAANAG